MMLTAEDARDLATEFRAQFHSQEAFEESWRRLWVTMRVPTLERARQWLVEDLARDGVMAGALIREPLLPVQQSFELTDCGHCGGLGYLRRDLPVGHPEFGRLMRCEACSNPAHDRVSCKTCSPPQPGRLLYLGPQTPYVPADWQAGAAIPAGWTPRRVVDVTESAAQIDGKAAEFEPEIAPVLRPKRAPVASRAPTVPAEVMQDLDRLARAKQPRGRQRKEDARA